MESIMENAHSSSTAFAVRSDDLTETLTTALAEIKDPAVRAKFELNGTEAPLRLTAVLSSVPGHAEKVAAAEAMAASPPPLAHVLRQGIDPFARAQCWLEWSGAKALRAKETSPTYYADLVASSRTAVKKTVLFQIEVDLPRTHADHPFFATAAGRDTLRRILSVYAARNLDIGYTQVRLFYLFSSII